MLNNRLSFVTGLRYEKTKDLGEGVLNNPSIVYQRNANGSLRRCDPVTRVSSACSAPTSVR